MRPTNGRWKRWGALAAIVLTAAGASVVLPLAQWAEQFIDWMRGAGFAGVLSYAVVYIVATVLLLPGSLLTAGAGFVYGPIWGTVLVSPVSVAAATAAFLVGRTAARDRVARRVSADARFRAIDAAIGRSGLRLVILLRLSALLPFNLLNYALGVTSVGLRDFVIGSFVGMFPGTVLYVYLGSVVSNFGALSSGVSADGVASRAIYWLGLAATVAAAVVIARIAKRAIQTELGDSTREGPRGPGRGVRGPTPLGRNP